MKQAILDTGPLVAFFNPRDTYHTWTLEQSKNLASPLITCEAVVTEAYHLLGRVPQARRTMMRWIALGRVTIPFQFAEHIVRIEQLLLAYEDQPMDFADACFVWMAESLQLPVFTIDVKDFSIYRINRDETISVIAPF